MSDLKEYAMTGLTSLFIPSAMTLYAITTVCTGLMQRHLGRVLGGLLLAGGACLIQGISTEELESGDRAVRKWFSGALFGPPQHSPHTPDHGSGSAPWATLLLFVGTIVIALLAMVVWRRCSRRRAAHREEQAVRTAETERWAALRADHDVVRDAYGAYRTDVLAVLDRPALDDASVPETAEFLCALFEADDARRGADLDAYREAVARLRVAWKAADSHARRAGTGVFDHHDRAAIAQARKLLIRAQDGAGGPYEQRIAVVKARKLLMGVLPLPREAVQELEARHQLSLAKSNSSSARPVPRSSCPATAGPSARSASTS